MSKVRVFSVPNGLRTKLLESGGLRAEELLRHAEDNLQFMRPRCLNQITDLISQIVETYGAGCRTGDEPFAGLYALSAKIIDVSAPVVELEIDRVAFSLCELVDRCEGQGGWDWPSVDVHTDALQLFRLNGGDLPSHARARIFQGLSKLTERLPRLSEVADAPPSGSRSERTSSQTDGDPWQMDEGQTAP